MNIFCLFFEDGDQELETESIPTLIRPTETSSSRRKFFRWSSLASEHKSDQTDSTAKTSGISDFQ